MKVATRSGGRLRQKAAIAINVRYPTATARAVELETSGLSAPTLGWGNALRGRTPAYVVALPIALLLASAFPVLATAFQARCVAAW
jgi:hypothetical protein